MTSNVILYIGSGKSSLQVNRMNLSPYSIACANNSWKLFENKPPFDFWIHSGDFPRENFPTQNNFKQEISHVDYSQTALTASQIFGWETKSPQHYLGYTIFFLGLYWLMLTQRPSKIGLLGFDHDYNLEKFNKWNVNGRPNIQNQFNKKTEKTIIEWSNKFFDGMEPDFFYGHGTPDPLRLGEEHLLKKIELAVECSKKLNIKLVNFSLLPSKINTIERESPNFS